MGEEIKSKEEILFDAFKSREQEVLIYEINIKNYTLALEQIEKMSVEEKADMASFADQLRNLLVTEKIECTKAKIMLNVLKSQVS
jgi:hypothetical protein